MMVNAFKMLLVSEARGVFLLKNVLFRCISFIIHTLECSLYDLPNHKLASVETVGKESIRCDI